MCFHVQSNASMPLDHCPPAEGGTLRIGYHKHDPPVEDRMVDGEGHSIIQHGLLGSLCS